VPDTGEVIAAANVLRDPETGVVSCTSTNLSAIWAYEPGSIMKPLTVSGVLEAGLAGPHEEIVLPDQIEIAIEHGQTKRYTDWFAHEQATYTPAEIVTRSSNIGTITLAERLGADGLYEMLTGFGLGSRTALEFKGEASGILDPLDSHVLELSNVAIGQSVAVTGIQMIQAYNTIANRGMHVDPVLVIDDVGDGEARRVISEDTADAVFAMMRSVVEEGTGRRAQLPGYRVAGKTGTAWQPCEGGIGYLCADDGRHYTASFAGIISNDLGPELSVIVIIDEPQGITGGGAVAAPVFAEIAAYAVRQLRIPPASGTHTGERVRAMAASAPVDDAEKLEDEGDA
jgi:cell division protein FtsI/penicillin-binding protein 2